jgi:hypothetical protein
MKKKVFLDNTESTKENIVLYILQGHFKNYFFNTLAAIKMFSL